MVLYIIDNSGMMSKRPRRLYDVAVGVKYVEVPKATEFLFGDGAGEMISYHNLTVLSELPVAKCPAT
jgi:hypothetical protein